MKIDIWSDIACPWCYIGITRLEKALDAFPHKDGVEIAVHSYQLDPTLPEQYDGTEIEYLSSRKAMPEAHVRQMFEQVKQTAAQDGLTMNFDTLVVANSRRAHQVLHAALNADPSGDLMRRLKLALFKAHFTDGASISDPEVLVTVATEAGLDAQAARDAIDNPQRDAEVTADIRRAAQIGVQGVPFFVFADKYAVSGAQPVEYFEQALAQVWNEVHPEPTPLADLGVGVASGPSCGVNGCD